MTLITKSGTRMWCPTHKRLHGTKRCPSCKAERTEQNEWNRSVLASAQAAMRDHLQRQVKRA